MDRIKTETLNNKTMKTYQAFARTSDYGQLINTEIRAKNKEHAQKWFKENTLEHESIHLKQKH